MLQCSCKLFLRSDEQSQGSHGHRDGGSMDGGAAVVKVEGVELSSLNSSILLGLGLLLLSGQTVINLLGSLLRVRGF